MNLRQRIETLQRHGYAPSDDHLIDRDTVLADAGPTNRSRCSNFESERGRPPLAESLNAYNQLNKLLAAHNLRAAQMAVPSLLFKTDSNGNTSLEPISNNYEFARQDARRFIIPEPEIAYEPYDFPL